MASTPSPSIERPSTPPAPRFGSYHDHWEPFPRRKSSRISSQQSTSAVRTPSPPCESTMKPEKRTSKGSARKPNPALLTPTKTPRRTTTMKEFSGQVFPPVDESVLSRSGRTSEKISGSTLESFVAEEEAQDFPIFSDTCNRIPQKDESNPFWNPPAEPKRPAQAKRRTVRIPGEGSKSIEEAVGREDGMVMNFRGKTYFQPMAKSADADSNEVDELTQGDESRVRPKTQAFKPRLLWPSKKKTEEKDLIDEEEATTDIEDANLPDEDDLPASPVTPARNRSTKAAPNAPKFPVSPPTTQRTTRSTDKLAHSSPSRGKAGRSQPVLNYNKWGSVAKTHKPATSTTGKRAAEEPLGRDRPKRARSSEAQA